MSSSSNDTDPTRTPKPNEGPATTHRVIRRALRTGLIKVRPLTDAHKKEPRTTRGYSITFKFKSDFNDLFNDQESLPTSDQTQPQRVESVSPPQDRRTETQPRNASSLDA